MGKNRILFLVGGALAVLLAAAIAMFNVRPSVKSVPEAGPEQQEEVPAGEGEMSVKVYFPDGTRVRMETRTMERVFSQKKILKGALQEFLKGVPDAERNIIPEGSILLGVYMGNDGVAYINFSEDFKRNFHGDVQEEYLLLRAVYETAVSNVNVEDVKILIDNKETDSVGGHFESDRPLKHLVRRDTQSE